ncbi:hypothetical protein [uncultured Desulfobacter sp.]|uniref:hypothetical protein n=1 Tax=uncultured Desulfobacter sp. TaxID=240139 RepID=UPI002AA79F95|nr:hypothetical protein [uncultured Desulfobacter sp.]
MLIILCLWLFIYTGGFFGEWIKRRQKRSNKPLSAFLEEISRGGTLPKEVQSMLSAHITAYVRDLESILKQPGILKAEKIEDLNQKKQHALLKRPWPRPQASPWKKESPNTRKPGRALKR